MFLQDSEVESNINQNSNSNRNADNNNNEVMVNTDVRESKSGKLEYEEFLKCLRSYHNFLDLWWRMKVDYLEELIKS